jgi:hypothetical protein
MPKKFSRQRWKAKAFKSNYFLIEEKGWYGKRVGKGGDAKSNNFVGKKKKTYNAVGLRAVGLWVNLKFLNAVSDNPLSGF